jgi:hypothetical protein
MRASDEGRHERPNGEAGLAMSNSRRITVFAASVLVGLSGCDMTGFQRTTAAEPAVHDEQPRNESKGKKMIVTIGTKTFTATLDDNPTVAKLRAMLPLTLDMSDLNGNEKHCRLPTPLPTDAADPATIRNGDLMLWGSDTLVLFYKSFPTSYSYTRLGRVDDPAGLAVAVGSGSVKVTFELE